MSEEVLPLFQHKMQSCLFDMHAHTQFCDDLFEPLISQDRLYALCCTLGLTSFLELSCRYGACEQLRVACGLHPWRAADESFVQEACRIAEYIQSYPFVGEVGLDFSRKHAASRAVQIEALQVLLEACAARSGDGDVPGLISLHSVQSTSCLLDMIEPYVTVPDATHPWARIGGRVVIFHSFAGTSDELVRIQKMGALLSVGPRMTASKKGRAYISTLKTTALLLESDLPSRPGELLDFATWVYTLEELLLHISTLKAVPQDELCTLFAQQSATILGIKKQ